MNKIKEIIKNIIDCHQKFGIASNHYCMSFNIYALWTPNKLSRNNDIRSDFISRL